MPVRSAGREDGGRAAASLSNLRGRVSVVKEGYGFIVVEKPERATVYAHRSAIINPKPKDPRNFGGLQEGDRVIVDVKESPPQFKVRHQAVRVQLGDSDAGAAQHNSPSVPGSGPKKAGKGMVNQVGTVCSVDENGGTLRFGAENEERAVFDRRCVPNTLLKPTEKVSDIFSVGHKVGFNARLTNTGTGAAQWQATLVTTVLRGNTSQVTAFETDIPTRVSQDSNSRSGDKLVYVSLKNDPGAAFLSSQRCPASSASSALPRSKFPTDSRTLVTAASFLPGPARTDKSDSNLVPETSVTPFPPIVTRTGNGNGASAVRLHGQLSTESRTAATASSLRGPARSNTSLVPDTSIAAAAPAPTEMQSSPGNSASAVPPDCQWSTETRTLSTASYAPRSAKNSIPALPTNAALRTSVPVTTERSNENGASAFRTCPQQTTEFPTLFPASNHSDHDKAGGRNTSLFYDTNVASRTSAPVVTQSSTAATEHPDERGGPQRCNPRWAMGINRASTKANPAAPDAGDHSIPAIAEQPPKTTPFEKSSRQGSPLAANSYGCFKNDSTRTAVRRQALRSGYHAPTTAGHHRRPATAVPIATRRHCGAGEGEQELAETIAKMVMPRLRSVIREEMQALTQEILGHTGITAGAGDVSSGLLGSSSKAPKAFIQPRKTPVKPVEGGDVATGFPN